MSRKAVKAPDFNLRSYAEQAPQTGSEPPRYVIVFRQVIRHGPGHGDRGQRKSATVHIKLLTDGESPEKLSDWQMKILKTSIASLQLILKNVADRPNQNPAVLKTLKKQIQAHQACLAASKRPWRP